MKKYMVLVVVLFIILGVGIFYSQNEFVRVNETVIGESENWHVKYRINSITIFTQKGRELSHQQMGSGDWVLTYKGDSDDLSALRRLSVRTKMRTSSSSFPEGSNELVFRFGGKANDDIKRAILNDQDIMVIIEWDNESDEIELFMQ